MLSRYFTEHPQSVGETYVEHMGQSLFFASHLIVATGASIIHAFLPFLCTSTASGRIRLLHDCMVMNRRKHEVTDVAPEMHVPE